MRRKHLNQMKIIELLINNKEMSLEQIKKKTGVLDDTIHSKTLNRYLEELKKEKYIVYKDGVYQLNKEQFLVNNHEVNDVWKKLLACAIESGEIDCYRKIKEFIKPEFQDNLLSDEALLRFQRTIIENVKILNDDEDKIQSLKTAIREERQLQIEYKGKLMQVSPLCIVVSRDGVRNYLFGLRKNLIILDLLDIHIVGKLEKKSIPNREEYLDKIYKSWDIDNQKPVHVKLLLRRDYDEDGKLERQLKKYFGVFEKYQEKEIVFEGELIGINDFKIWLREHMEACYILEPKQVREEFIEALTVKIGRYEQNG